LSKDITPILEGWDHEPDELQVRLIAGDDGREKMQVRLDLGLFQMELNGRPDGRRPRDFESLLDLHEARARERGGDYTLDEPDCVALMREGVQYYHRYIALFHLRRYDLVARDTSRNLRLFAFVVAHAPRSSDRLQFDQYRPYVTLIRARALALQALDRGDHRAALSFIDEGIAGLRAFLRDYDRQDQEDEMPELTFLTGWRAEVDRERPVGPAERLEQQLARAVAAEEFEEAARLRDQLRRLRDAEAGAPSRPS
jgi:hypothetical protein